MRKRSFLAIIAVVVATLAMILTASPAGAKPAPPEPPVSVEYTCLIGIETDCPLHPYDDEWITPPGGSTGLISVSGSSTARVYRPPGTYPCRVNYMNNSSEAAWWGSSPYNASVIKLMDIWDTDWIGVTGISIADKPGGSIIRGNGVLEWETTQNNNWRLAHSDSGVRMDIDCYVGRLTGVNFNSFGTFDFGGVTYRVKGYDGAGIVSIIQNPI